MDRVEIQTNDSDIFFDGEVFEHVDVKVGGGTYYIESGTKLSFYFWVGAGCAWI